MSSRRPSIRVLLATSGWPSGILDVGSWAANRGLAEVAVVQLPPGNPSPSAPEEEPFFRKLVEFAPHVVGFRLEGGGFEQVRDYVRAVRLMSAAEIVLGGPTATSHPREALEDTGADYVFAGEAEETFAQFLQLARQRDSRDRQPEIPGLAYRYGGRTYVNTLPCDGYGRSRLDVDRRPHGDRLRCLRNLVRPMAGAEVIAANRLDWSLLEGFREPLDSLFFTGGRGCPGTCMFCAKLHGQEVRVKSARQLIEEIEAADGQVQSELFDWIDRLKPMVQLGAESFNPEVLARWHKRHNLDQLNRVLDALDQTRQDYTVFQLLTDFDTTAEELVETLRLLIVNAYRRRRMRIASSPFTIPLYDSDTRADLAHRGRLAGRIRHFTDYERPQPGWMDPLVAELADAELCWALELRPRAGALVSAFEAVRARIAEEAAKVEEAGSPPGHRRRRMKSLDRQAAWGMNQIKETRFQGLG